MYAFTFLFEVRLPTFTFHIVAVLYIAFCCTDIIVEIMLQILKVIGIIFAVHKASPTDFSKSSCSKQKRRQLSSQKRRKDTFLLVTWQP